MKKKEKRDEKFYKEAFECLFENANKDLHINSINIRQQKEVGFDKNFKTIIDFIKDERN